MPGTRFIINPKAGTGDSIRLTNYIGKWISAHYPQGEIALTRKPGDGKILAQQAVAQNYDAVIAVGGDGSVNEIASAIAGSRVKLGIVPCGSGNGVARHFGISLNIEKALQSIAKGHTHKIDTGLANGKRFIMLVGAGFDAYVAKLFNLEHKRGLITYTKLAASGYFKFHTQPFTIRVDDRIMHRDALMVVVANCSQFGNNARIAPGALADDGLLNISIVKKAPLQRLPSLIWQLFNGTLTPGKNVEMFAGKYVQIEQTSDYSQIDGEYFACGKKIEISIDPLSLNIITPEP